VGVPRIGIAQSRLERFVLEIARMLTMLRVAGLDCEVVAAVARTASKLSEVLHNHSLESLDLTGVEGVLDSLLRADSILSQDAVSAWEDGPDCSVEARVDGRDVVV